jgi:hypothetical protein
MRVVQMLPGPLPDLDHVRAAPGEKFHARGARHVSRDDRQLRKRRADEPHRIPHSAAVTMRGRDRHDIDAALHEAAHMRANALLVQLTGGVPSRRDGRAAEQPELRIARGLQLGGALLEDPLDVADREETGEPILVIDDEQLVNADVFGEEAVCPRDRIGRNLALRYGVHLRSGRHRLSHANSGIPRAHHMPGQQPEQLAARANNRERAEPEPLLFDHREHIADRRVGTDFDRLLDQSVDVVLHPAHLAELLPLRHVAMNQAEPAGERHRDRHRRLGDGVHIRADDRQLQRQALVQRGRELRLARQDFRVKRRERDVVVSQRDRRLFAKKDVCGFVKRAVDGGNRFCHGRKWPVACAVKRRLLRPSNAGEG